MTIEMKSLESRAALVRTSMNEFYEKNRDKLKSVNNWSRASFGNGKEATLREFLNGQTLSPGIIYFFGWAQGASILLGREVTFSEMTGDHYGLVDITEEEAALIKALRKKPRAVKKLIEAISEFDDAF